MIKITDNGIAASKGDVFNLLLESAEWDDSATYTCEVSGSGGNLSFDCEVFREKYLRIYSNAFNLKAGTYTLTVKKNDAQVYTKALIIKEVSHNE